MELGRKNHRLLGLRVLVCALALLSLTATGCAHAETTRITATFYPLYVAAINIAHGVDGVSVSCLAPPSAGCLHDYQMTTADRKLLTDSDIILRNGAGLEAFLDALPDIGDRSIDASAGIALLLDAHGEENPHVWASVDGMIAEVRNIVDGLCRLDPANAAQYRANGDDYIARLTMLGDEMAERLAPLAGAPIVTFHEAFAYFADTYGLRVVAVVENDPGSAPSARRMAEIADTIRAEGARALFAEPQYSDASVMILTRETGVPVFTLDPGVTGTVDPDDVDAYLRVMRQNADTLLEALLEELQ